MTTSSSRVCAAPIASAAAALLAFAQAALAQAPTLLSSSATIVHAAGFSAAQRSVVLNALPSFPSIGAATPPLQLPLGLLGNASTNSTAKAGLGVVTSASVLGVVVAPGTALTQKGNTNASPATASSLSITFAAQWQLNAPSPSNPLPNAGASFSVTGVLPVNPPPGPNVPSPTAFFSLGLLDCQFNYTTPGSGSGMLRTPINNPNFLFTNFQGPYTLNAMDVLPSLPSALPAGTIVNISGTFLFRVHNENDEAMLTDVRQSGVAGPDHTDFLDKRVPGPGAAATLALGGLLAARRRRA